jgi:hypothetical protein
MSVLGKLLTGAAGLAAVAGFASPAAAQYYPGYGYGNGGGVVGAIVNSVIGGGAYGRPGYGGYGAYGYGNPGYGGYATNDRFAVDQCSRAVEARLGGGYGGYGSYGGGYGGGRVLGISRIERKNSGLRVHGFASSGARAGYGGYGGADLTFNCKVDYRGGISSLNLDRANNGYGRYNGYNGYNRGF